jgi:DNA-binding Lrp family transcriptional regulator
LRDLELRLIIELIKNSRRSDRELAKHVGTSQPTVTRLRGRLEKEGYIQEYSIVPNFKKLGFQILAFTFTEMKRPFAPGELEKSRKNIRKLTEANPPAAIAAMTGMGCDADRVIVSFHKSYSDYADFIKRVRQHPLVIVEGVKSFLVNIDDGSHLLPLTFSQLANYLSKDTNLSKKVGKQ